MDEASFPTREEVDFVVIGSGAAGGIMAKELAGLQQAAAGKSSPPKKPDAGDTIKTQTFKPVAPSPAPAAAEESTFHTVTAGETLYSISRLYDMSVDKLLKANQLDKEATIYPGQKLKVR